MRPACAHSHYTVVCKQVPAPDCVEPLVAQYPIVSDGNRFRDRSGGKKPPPICLLSVLSPLGGENTPGRSGGALRYIHARSGVKGAAVVEHIITSIADTSFIVSRVFLCSVFGAASYPRRRGTLNSYW